MEPVGPRQAPAWAGAADSLREAVWRFGGFHEGRAGPSSPGAAQERTPTASAVRGGGVCLIRDRGMASDDTDAQSPSPP